MYHNHCQVFMRWIAWGKKLFLCLVVLVLSVLIMLIKGPDNGGAEYAWGDFAQFQWSVEDLCEDGASWSAQDFRQTGVTQSGPGAFLLFCFRKSWRTSSSLIWIAGVGERLVAGGVDGCVERCSGRVWFFFQTYSRTHSDHLPVVDSPQCWGMVSYSWLSLSDISTLILSHCKII